MYYQSTGSPPHRRGKGGTDHSGDLRHGFTPAQAGKRTKAAAICRWCRDHPRAGGEKHNVFTLGSLVQGSPPRGRGKDSGTVHGCGQLRITPALAGKRNWAIGSRLLNWDHPRVGGEKGSYRWVIKSVKGSPPRWRGKAIGMHYCAGVHRITPALAGKSCGWASCGGLSWDHPRVGGEK